VSKYTGNGVSWAVCHSSFSLLSLSQALKLVERSQLALEGSSTRFLSHASCLVPGTFNTSVGHSTTQCIANTRLGLDEGGRHCCHSNIT